MQITFSGPAQAVTGSCHILEVGGRTLMLVLGLFQGRRADSRRKNEVLPLPVDRIEAIVLSHAHIDHAGRLPFLVESGYAGNIHSTAATHELCAIMLADSARIQVKDADLAAKGYHCTVPAPGDQVTL